MNKLTVLMICLVLSIGAMAQKSFEGVLKMDMVNPAINEKSSLTWYVKGGKHMMEVNSVANNLPSTANLYMDNKSTQIQMITAMNGQKMLYKIDGSQLASKLQLGVNVTVTKTNESKIIAGKTCKKNVIKDSKGKIVVWVTEGLNINTNSLPEAFKNGSLLANLKANGISGYPLEIVATDLSGQLIYSQVFTSIKEESLSDATFSMPAGVNTFEENMNFEIK